MSTLKVCRICVRTECKMYQYDKLELKCYYEEIMAEMVTYPDQLPHYFCYECAAMLYKFHKFKEKCLKGQKTLKGLMHQNSISLQSIKSLNKKNKNPFSTLGIISVNDRVKTYFVKRHRTSKRKDKAKRERRPDTVQIKSETIDDYSSDTNDFELPNEMDYTNDDDVKLDLNNYSEPEIFVHEQQIFKVEEYELDIENALKIGKALTVDDKQLDNELLNENDDITMDNFSDDDNIKLSNVKENISNLKSKLNINIDGSKVKKMRKAAKISKYIGRNAKAKKFEKKKRELDPDKWLTVNLTEEQAVEEFRARAQSSRYFAAEHKCVKCLKGFSTGEMLQRHIHLRHNESNPVECRHCQMRFKWKCKLTGHMSEHYTKYKCLRCDQSCLTVYGAVQHEDLHNGVTWKCEHCGEEFNHQNSYYTHLRTHRSEYVCALCGASFVNDRGLYLHKRNKHRNEASGDGEGQYCSRCDIRFETQRAYDEHFIHSAKHDDVKDFGKDAKLSKPRIRRFRNKKRPANCHVCGKHFESQRAYRKHHLSEHPGTAMFSPDDRQICEVCGVSVAPNKMFQHRTSHGGDKKPVSCPVCGKRFKQEAGMKYHYSIFHETDPAKKKIPRKFTYSVVTCDICGVNASSKANLQRHMLVHTGEKPFKCTLCDKRFTQKNSMQLHYRTFHLKEPYPKRNRRK